MRLTHPCSFGARTQRRVPYTGRYGTCLLLQIEGASNRDFVIIDLGIVTNVATDPAGDTGDTTASTISIQVTGTLLDFVDQGSVPLGSVRVRFGSARFRSTSALTKPQNLSLTHFLSSTKRIVQIQIQRDAILSVRIPAPPHWSRAQLFSRRFGRRQRRRSRGGVLRVGDHLGDDRRDELHRRRQHTRQLGKLWRCLGVTAHQGGVTHEVVLKCACTHTHTWPRTSAHWEASRRTRTSGLGHTSNRLKCACMSRHMTLPRAPARVAW